MEVIAKMAEFTEIEKKIALVLLEGPMSLSELRERFPGKKDSLQQALNKMIRLNLAEKKGSSYSLREKIAKELEKRRDILESDFFKLRLKAYIEMQAVNRELLEREIAAVEEAIKKQKDLTLYSLKAEKIAEQEDYFSTFIELDFTVKDFSTLVKFMFFFSPSSIEVIRPPKIEIAAFDLQEGLMDLIDMVEKYNSYIRKEHSKKGLDRFHKRLFSAQGKK